MCSSCAAALHRSQSIKTINNRFRFSNNVNRIELKCSEMHHRPIRMLRNVNSEWQSVLNWIVRWRFVALKVELLKARRRVTVWSIGDAEECREMMRIRRSVHCSLDARREACQRSSLISSIAQLKTYVFDKFEVFRCFHSFVLWVWFRLTSSCHKIQLYLMASVTTKFCAFLMHREIFSPFFSVSASSSNSFRAAQCSLPASKVPNVSHWECQSQTLRA